MRLRFKQPLFMATWTSLVRLQWISHKFRRPFGCFQLFYYKMMKNMTLLETECKLTTDKSIRKIIERFGCWHLSEFYFVYYLFVPYSVVFCMKIDGSKKGTSSVFANIEMFQPKKFVVKLMEVNYQIYMTVQMYTFSHSGRFWNAVCSSLFHRVVDILLVADWIFFVRKIRKYSR